jgi:hypothetical protein
MSLTTPQKAKVNIIISIGVDAKTKNPHHIIDIFSPALAQMQTNLFHQYNLF